MAEDKDAESSRKPWSDGDKMAYMCTLLNSPGMTINWNAAPIPKDRTLRACRRMVQNLHGQLKDPIATLLEGATFPEDASSTEPKRGRGRPKKIKTTTAAAAANTGDEKPDGKQSAPKTNKTSKRKAVKATNPGKPGKRAKKESDNESSEDAKNEESPKEEAGDTEESTQKATVKSGEESDDD